MQPAFRNNFNLLRLVFASAVVLSHAYALLGFEKELVLWGRSLGNFSVHGFFVISGYLISESFVRYPSVLAFSVNRFLRIIPALLVAIWVAKKASALCGGFALNPIPYISNGPIWTLTWEIICYGFVALFGVIGVLNKQAMPSIFAAIWLVYLVGTSSVSPFYGAIAPMFMMFLGGAFIRVAEDHINMRKAIVPVAVVFIFAYGLATSEPILNLIKSNIVFLWGPVITNEDVRRVAYLATFPFIVIFVGRYAPTLWAPKDDISYGVYIYGWPVAQVLVYLAMQRQFQFTPIKYFLVTMAITVPLAWFSWRLIERPALKLKMRAPKASLPPTELLPRL